MQAHSGTSLNRYKWNSVDHSTEATLLLQSRAHVKSSSCSNEQGQVQETAKENCRMCIVKLVSLFHCT